MKVDHSRVKGTLQYNNGDTNENVTRDYSNSLVSLKSGDHVRAQHVPVKLITLPFNFCTLKSKISLLYVVVE